MTKEEKIITMPTPEDIHNVSYQKAKRKLTMAFFRIGAEIGFDESANFKIVIDEQIYYHAEKLALEMIEAGWQSFRFEKSTDLSGREVYCLNFKGVEKLDSED